jgi:hypothetical protein
MFVHRRFVAPTLLVGILALACSPERTTSGTPTRGAFAARELPPDGPQRSAVDQSSSSAVSASGNYTFFIPADYNGGIFGVAIDNHVTFSARRSAGGEVSGGYHYEQSVEGQNFIFSGTVTCLQIYDTPVLQNFPGIPAMTQNRAKWGGLIKESNDPTLPPGGFIWFQSIDNGGAYPDLSTLSGFGNEAANEAFCNSPNVPNPNFGPHAVLKGNIDVQ